MRVYLPATLADLAGTEGLPPRRGHALTPALAAALGTAGGDSDDAEAGEFQALVAAAADSLAMLRDRGHEPPVRVVVAADIDDVEVPQGDPEPSAVFAPAVPWRAVVSFHIDDRTDLAGAAQLRGAIAGQAGAEEAVAELDLLWYDVSERADLLT
ncbi:DUF6912 family protein [Pseudactinotalea sp. Z1732]|uniref:DUF6912 family protein n=1 Tax=Micrococcales TaxID=85006 RepID=UPI003C7E6BF7